MVKYLVMILIKTISKNVNRAIKITLDCPYRRTFHSDQGLAYQIEIILAQIKRNKYFKVY